MAIRNSMGKQLNERVQIHPDGSREYWRDVPNYVGLYRVSSRGRVKSLGRHITRIRYGKPYTSYKKEKILFLQECTGQHLVTKLSNDDGYKNVFVHRLVLEAFVGPCPEGMECRHLDGNGANNNVENLKWDSHLNNMGDLPKHGKSTKGRSFCVGSSNGFSVLVEKQVIEIRTLYASGSWTQKELADRYNVTIPSISLIVNRKTWKHV